MSEEVSSGVLGRLVLLYGGDNILLAEAEMLSRCISMKMPRPAANGVSAWLGGNAYRQRQLRKVHIAAAAVLYTRARLVMHA